MNNKLVEAIRHHSILKIKRESFASGIEWAVSNDDALSSDERVNRLKDSNLKLAQENLKLREALQFYSYPVSYHTHYKMGYGLQKSADKYSSMDVDSGQVARLALEVKV